MATRHDPWKMRLGGFVTSQSFREAPANYEKEQEKNKEKPPERREAGRVRSRALPQHQQPRAKMSRPRDPRPDYSAVAHAGSEPQAPPLPPRHGTQFRLRCRRCLHSLCAILLKLLRASAREVFCSTPQSHRNKKTATQFCSLAACVSAWVLQGKVKMQSRHFAGPRNILKKKVRFLCENGKKTVCRAKKHFANKKARFLCCFFVYFENWANWTHNWSLD